MSIEHRGLEEAVRLIDRADNITILTGAGMSVESGIALFRGEDGLWQEFDPQEYASMESFLTEPERCWELFRLQIEEIRAADPHKGHLALVELEEQGVKTVITQNVDSLHQDAGSHDVIELHGSFSGLVCLECQNEFNIEEYMDEISSETAPVCSCGAILKPKAVLFGGSLPQKAIHRAQRSAERSDLMLVIGTSAVVQPAASLPSLAKKTGADVIEINTDRTPLTRTISDIFLDGKAGEVLSKLVDELG